MNNLKKCEAVDCGELFKAEHDETMCDYCRNQEVYDNQTVVFDDEQEFDDYPIDFVDDVMDYDDDRADYYESIQDYYPGDYENDCDLYNES